MSRIFSPPKMPAPPAPVIMQAPTPAQVPTKEDAQIANDVRLQQEQKKKELIEQRKGKASTILVDAKSRTKRAGNTGDMAVTGDLKMKLGQ